jgi:hypothetical protein
MLEFFPPFLDTARRNAFQIKTFLLNQKSFHLDRDYHMNLSHIKHLTIFSAKGFESKFFYYFTILLFYSLPIERGHLCEFKDSTRLRIYNYIKNKGNKARTLIVWLVVFTRVKMLRGSQCAKPEHQQTEVLTSAVALVVHRYWNLRSPARPPSV